MILQTRLMIYMYIKIINKLLNSKICSQNIHCTWRHVSILQMQNKYLYGQFSVKKNLSWINPCGIRISHPRGWIFWQGARQAVWFPYPTWIFMIDSINFAPVWCLDLKQRSGDLLTCDRPSLRLSLIHIWRCRRYAVCRSRWSPYH